MAGASMPLLTLIICTYQRPKPFRRLLTALTRQTRIPERILVIDASPTDASAVVCREIAATALPGLEYHAVTIAERGLTRQRNRGVDLALAGQSEEDRSVLAFLDDDTVPETDYYEQIMACFDRHPEAVGVGGMIVNDALWRQDAEASRPTVPSTNKAENRFGIQNRRFYWNSWSFPEDPRRLLRHRLGLCDDRYPPGWMPPDGHGRSVAFYPPNGQDHQVEYFLGGTAAFRSELFRPIPRVRRQACVFQRSCPVTPSTRTWIFACAPAEKGHCFSAPAPDWPMSMLPADVRTGLPTAPW